MRLATSTSIFGKPLDISAVLSALEQAEFDAIELFCNPDHFDPRDRGAVARLKQRLAGSGVQIWSLHAPFSQELDISLPDETRRTRTMALDLATIALAGELGGNS